ncbi:MAG: hypothetical protein AAB660_02955, partial [Patescibacteria group bacterium]
CMLIENPDRLTALVQFLDILSRWADRGAIAEVITMFDKVNYGQYDELRGRLGEIQSCLTGIRDRYGWNRTEVGETVTDGKVYGRYPFS